MGAWLGGGGGIIWFKNQVTHSLIYFFDGYNIDSVAVDGYNIASYASLMDNMIF